MACLVVTMVVDGWCGATRLSQVYNIPPSVSAILREKSVIKILSNQLSLYSVGGSAACACGDHGCLMRVHPRGVCRDCTTLCNNSQHTSTSTFCGVEAALLHTSLRVFCNDTGLRHKPKAHVDGLAYGLHGCCIVCIVIIMSRLQDLND